MPVDNEFIQTYIDNLGNKERELSDKGQQVRNARHGFEGILQKEETKPDPNNPTKQIKIPIDIMDTQRGQKMTVTRRQEIYDHWIAEADKLLA